MWFRFRACRTPVDVYTLDVPADCSSVIISTESALDTVGLLADATCTILGEADDTSDVDYDFTFGPLPLAAGTYSVAVRGFSLEDAGPYTLHVDAACSPAAVFWRGEANGDGNVNIADAVCLLGYLFGGPEDPCKATVVQCLDAADANDDGTVNIADGVAVLSHLFGGTGPLAGPFGACGVDPTADAIGCADHGACE